jgi:hypothetical protein
MNALDRQLLPQPTDAMSSQEGPFDNPGNAGLPFGKTTAGWLIPQVREEYGRHERRTFMPYPSMRQRPMADGRASQEATCKAGWQTLPSTSAHETGGEQHPVRSVEKRPFKGGPPSDFAQIISRAEHTFIHRPS